MNSTIKILIVHGDLVLARFIHRGLREEGYGVDLADGAEEGLPKGMFGSYDLIVLGSGLRQRVEILQTLRSWGTPARIAVVSIDNSRKAKKQMLDAGADDYIVPRFGWDGFMSRVRTLLSSRTPRG